MSDPRVPWRIAWVLVLFLGVAPAGRAAGLDLDKCFHAKQPKESAVLRSFRFIDVDGVDVAADPARRLRLLCDPAYRPHSVFGTLVRVAPGPDGQEGRSILVGPQQETPFAFLTRRLHTLRFLERQSKDCDRRDVGAFYSLRTPGEAGICDESAAPGLDWLEMLLHEARHADGIGHVACRYGLILQPDGCDESFSGFGAYRVSFEYQRAHARNPDLWAGMRHDAAMNAVTLLLQNFRSLAPEFELRHGAYLMTAGELSFFDGSRAERLGGQYDYRGARILTRPERGIPILLVDAAGTHAYASPDGAWYREARRGLVSRVQGLLDQGYGTDLDGRELRCRLEARRFACASVERPGKEWVVDLPFEAHRRLFKGDPQLRTEQLLFPDSGTAPNPWVKRLCADRQGWICYALISSVTGDIYAVRREFKASGRMLAEPVDSGHRILAAGTIRVADRDRTLIQTTDHRVSLLDEAGTAGGEVLFGGRRVDDVVLPDVWTSVPLR